MSLARNNHYVPQAYLKNWGAHDGKISVYSLLVPHEQFPLWQRRSISNTGSHNDLYLAATPNGDSDELERWFAQDIEAPAIESVRKALNENRLEVTDWEQLIRLYALQEARTPSSFHLFLKRWKNGRAEQFLNDTVAKSVKELEAYFDEGGIAPPAGTLRAESSFPFGLETQIRPGSDTGLLKAELVVGREFWHFAVRHIVTNSYKALLNQKWTILHVNPALEWPTTDHPSICHQNGNFVSMPNGPGWLTPGAELFMPLSPKHLLYTKIGSRPAPKRTVLNLAESVRIKTLLVRRAHRYVFCRDEDPQVVKTRHRRVRHDEFVREREAWQKLHQENSELVNALVRIKR